MEKTITSVKAWLTPGLLALCWFFVSRDLKEIRDDVRDLRESVPVLRAEFDILKADVARNEEKIWKLERWVAIKQDDEFDIPVKKEKKHG
jgi:hypothetical protein